MTEQSIKESKAIIRKDMLAQRDAMPRPEREAIAARICEQLWALVQEQEVRVINCYLNMGSEVNILPFLLKALGAGLTVVVPKTLKKRQMEPLVLTSLKNMEAGIFGTYHPKNAEIYTGHYDLIVVAGLAFDARGYRVGYGGGYYDTFLAGQSAALKMGVCYPFQRVEEVPIEAHDVRLDGVLCGE